jgi:hypothetical protein
VKRQEREHPLIFNNVRTMVQETTRGQPSPVQSIVANHELAIVDMSTIAAALQSGCAVMVEVPQRIGKRSGPTYTIFLKNPMYDW